MLCSREHVQRVLFNKMEVAQFIWRTYHRKVIQMKQDFLFFFFSIQHYIQCKLRNTNQW